MGNSLSPVIKARILDRAKMEADQNGFINGGSTERIMQDEEIEEVFANALGSDVNQLRILAELAKTISQQ
ncbi:MAG: hypothetical protein ACKUBY_00050 [Candidatus Moraniibacteriota bacterium]